MLIVSDIIDGIKWLIDFFFHKAPKPVLIIFFLLLIAVTSIFMSAVFHLIGYHCYSGAGNGLEVVKISPTEFYTNWQIWTSENDYLIGETLTICEAHPEMCGREKECYEYARYNSTTYYYDPCNETQQFADCNFYLRSQYGCNNCSVVEICKTSAQFWIFCGDWTSVCSINETAYGLPSVPVGVGCGGSSICYIPPNYIWNSTTGMYDCNSPELCGDGVEVQTNKRINQLINSVPHTQVYANAEGSISIDNAIYLKCNNDLNPEVTVYGLPVFDYRIWVLLLLIGILVYFLIELKQIH